MPSQPQRRQFVFVLDNGFTMQAFSSAVEVLRLLDRVRPGSGYGYHAVSLQDTEVAASNGFALIPDLRCAEVPARSVIVVVAGADANGNRAPSLAAQLRIWSRRGHPVWGVSSGVVRLAQAGLLDGCKAAAHWEDVQYLRDMHPEIEVSTSLFVRDGEVMTCAGGGAATDMMLNVLRKDLGQEVADEIAARLVIDAVRGGQVHQRRTLDMRYETSNPTVFAALRLMRANLFEPLAIADIARVQGISPRHLERLFEREFGQAPNRIYTELRLEEARQEVLDGRRSLTEIAMDYGYGPATFSRVYKRVFGALPSDDRSCARSDRIK